MGCNNLAIDLSTAAFKVLGDLNVGRTGATWWFGTEPATNAGAVGAHIEHSSSGLSFRNLDKIAASSFWGMSLFIIA